MNIKFLSIIRNSTYLAYQLSKYTLCEYIIQCAYHAWLSIRKSSLLQRPLSSTHYSDCCRGSNCASNCIWYFVPQRLPQVMEKRLMPRTGLAAFWYSYNKARHLYSISLRRLLTFPRHSHRYGIEHSKVCLLNMRSTSKLRLLGEGMTRECRYHIA